MSKKAIITVGVSGSGKSTWAKQFALEQERRCRRWEILECDSFRWDVLAEKRPDLRIHRAGSGRLYRGSTERLWTHWNWEWENEVFSRRLDRLHRYAALPYLTGVVLADTNLNPDLNAQLVTKLHELGFQVGLKYFPIEFATACENDLKRADSVGYVAIGRQMDKWNKYFKTPRVEPQTPDTRPSAWIVDIDGTLAHRNDRSPFDWSKVGTDTVDIAVRDILDGLPGRVLLVSGRDARCREATLQWLKDNEVSWNQLFMRPEGSNEKDTVIKERIYWEHIDSNYRVLGVIDDRPQVCRMWRALGLKVFQVADPYIEF